MIPYRSHRRLSSDLGEQAVSRYRKTGKVYGAETDREYAPAKLEGVGSSETPPFWVLGSNDPDAFLPVGCPVRGTQAQTDGFRLTQLRPGRPGIRLSPNRLTQCRKRS